MRRWENLSLCASSGANFHGMSSKTESAIKCLKPGLNPNRSCLAFSWKTSTSSNTCAAEIMGAFSACLYSTSERVYSSTAAYKYRRTEMKGEEEESTYFAGSSGQSLETGDIVDETTTKRCEQNSVVHSIPWAPSCLVLTRQFMFHCSRSEEQKIERTSDIHASKLIWAFCWAAGPRRISQLTMVAWEDSWTWATDINAL